MATEGQARLEALRTSSLTTLPRNFVPDSATTATPPFDRHIRSNSGSCKRGSPTQMCSLRRPKPTAPRLPPLLVRTIARELAGVSAEDIDDIRTGKFEPSNLIRLHPMRGQRPSDNVLAKIKTSLAYSCESVFFFAVRLPGEISALDSPSLLEGHWPCTRFHGSNLSGWISSMSSAADFALRDVGYHLKYDEE
ncbi:hypothetical protein E4U39_001168 [Claviceps sp. Clav50 group G5]|nr:hypothetical protein E4U39_001168 [Claviceps sp. Clav50 group G5]